MFWIINTSGLIASWYFTDLQSPSVIAGIICPILILIFTLSILRRLYLSLSGRSNVSANTKSSSSSHIFLYGTGDSHHDSSSGGSSSFGGDSGGGGGGGE
ncbi:hypothetical protein A7985_02150 [Pseudoalteromonas luteoviolacea]|uniref:Uncharacterized protein n=1 Tax=Pseudoalteromonas luteoviolacea TaxID=43657 RepID=A0A1C0TTY1_9GAMM|nr:hypothetical protein [Pseudoalteromonas luteoviolacea]OCQ22781.1 hypothetical protein A7985_02150 [Pseudoalteromonas luteoviolacea]